MKKWKNLTPVRTVLIYIVFGVLWIFISDEALNIVVPSSSDYVLLQTFKGWLFVFTSAALLYFILRSELKSLRDSEEKFKYIFDYSAVGKTITSPEGVITANKAFQKMLGYSEEELVGEKWREITHPDDIELSNQAIEPLLKGERDSARLTKRYLHKNGSVVWVDLNTSLRRDEAGQPMYFMTSVLDITERIKAETKLQESEQRYRSLFEHMTSGYAYCQLIFEHDQPHDFIYLNVNSAFEALTGLTEVEGKKVSEVIPGIRESNPELLETYARVARTGVPERLETYVAELGIWFVISVYSPKEEYFVAVFDNITERKRADAALQIENERFQRFVDSNIVGIVIANAAGRIITANDYYLHILGVTHQDFEDGKVDWREFTPPEWLPADEKALLELQESGTCEPYEKEYVRADGTRVSVYIADAMLPGPEQQIAAFVLDITNLKRAEAQLLYQAYLLENINDAIISTDPGFMIRSWNKGAEEIYGWQAEEVIGRSINEVVATEFPYDDGGKVLQQFASQGFWKGEVIQKCRNGAPLNILSSVSLIKDNTGNPTGAVAVNRDITERKQAEEKILSLSRFPSENPNPVLRITKDGILLYANPSSQPLLKLWMCTVGMKLPDHLQEMVSEALQVGVSKDVEIDCNGTVFSFNFASITEAGYINGYGRDITERKQVEIQIQKQLQHLNALRTIDAAISSSFDIHVTLDIVLQQVLAQLGVDASAILLFDPQLQTVEYAASRGFRTNGLRYTKLKLGEGNAGRTILERKTIHMSDLMETGGKLAEAVHLAGEGFDEYYGIPLISKDGIKGVLEIYHRSALHATPDWLDFLETLAGQAAIAIDNAQLFEDLQRSNADLEQRVAQRTEELNRTNIELEHANRAKDEFLASMSHELRTPLNSILGLSETLLEQRRGSLNPHQQKALQLIETSGQHLLALINDILDVSKIEAGKMDFVPETVSADAVCVSSLAFIRAQALKKSISVSYINESEVAHIIADSKRLKQILVNLLTNAVKFTPEHGSVTLKVTTDLDQNTIQFSVIDTGIGISLEDLKKLFQPFVQIDSRLNRQHEGTGLGLALVQKLTELHGGSVDVESEVGKGSRFTINLRCSEEDRANPHSTSLEITSSIDVDAAGAVTRLSSDRAGTLLLAEDTLSNILTIGDYLESFNFEVIVANNGAEALEKAAQIRPDLILMDIQMPVMDGLEAMRRLRTDPRFTATPIIALTALAMPGDRERCMEAGANEYMSKPVRLKTLVKTVETMLNSGKARSEQ